MGIPILKYQDLNMSKRILKRARTEEGGSGTKEEDADVRLSEGLRALFGKRKYVKKSEISRAHLMRYLCDKGEITEVTLLHVDIEVSLIIFNTLDHIRYV